MPYAIVIFFKLLKENDSKIFLKCFILNLFLICNLSYYIQLVSFFMFYFLFFTHEKKKIKKLLKFISIILIYNFLVVFSIFFQES